MSAKTRTTASKHGIYLVPPSHADADFDPYVHDQLTHSVTGEYNMGIFFLIAGGMALSPVMFPGIVLVFKARAASYDAYRYGAFIAQTSPGFMLNINDAHYMQAIHEAYPNLWGCML